jgi:aspartate 1-decarboxylase
MLRAKIHRAKVTRTNINYEGSIEIDEDLLDTVGILPFEQVHIYNINNGNRFETYVIKGERGSGIISVNGAAARLVTLGDNLIIASYAIMTEEEARNVKSKIIRLGPDNRIIT